VLQHKTQVDQNGNGWKVVAVKEARNRVQKNEIGKTGSLTRNNNSTREVRTRRRCLAGLETAAKARLQKIGVGEEKEQANSNQYLTSTDPIRRTLAPKYCWGKIELSLSCF